MKFNIFDMIKKVCPSILVQLPFLLLLIFVTSNKLLLAEGYNWIFDNMLNTNVYIILLLVLIAVSYGIGTYVYTYFAQTIKQKMIHVLQQQVLNNEMKKETQNWEKTDDGKWNTIISKDPSICGSFYSDVYIPFMFGLCEFVWALLYGFFNSYLLTIVILALSLFSWVLPKIVSGAVEATQEKKQCADEEIRTCILDAVKGFELIKAHQSEDFILSKFKKIYIGYADKSIQNAASESKMEALNIGIGFLANTIWMIIGLYFMKSDKLMLGQYVGFMVLCNSFNWLFFELSSLVSNYSRQKVSYRRLRIEEKTTTEEVSTQKNDILQCETLIADRLSFRYSALEDFIVKDFSYTFNSKKKYAITGKSGIGKTTLLKVLCGIYSSENGVLLFDNQFDGRNFNMNGAISYVPQRNYVFTDTILNNILVGKENASFDEVKEAARKAQAHEFIIALPKQYETLVGHNAEVLLSEGQMQRISLARAFLKNASFNYLDEVTSALDEETEEKVLENIKYLSGVIMIAHREKAINICDERIDLF